MFLLNLLVSVLIDGWVSFLKLFNEILMGIFCECVSFILTFHCQFVILIKWSFCFGPSCVGVGGRDLLAGFGVSVLLFVYDCIL